MSDKLIERLVAQEPYFTAQTGSEAKWQHELPGAFIIDGKSIAARVLSKTDSASQSETTSKTDGTAKLEGTSKTDGTPKTDISAKPDFPSMPETATSPQDLLKPDTATGTSQSSEAGAQKTSGSYPENRIGSGVIASALMGGISGAGFTKPTIAGANKLAYSLRGLQGSSILGAAAKDAANAWLADASATKLIATRADAMKGITTPTLPSLSQNLKSGAFNTLGVGVVLELDRLVFREPEDRSWNLSSLTAPLGMALGRRAPDKLLFAGLGLLPGHAIDRITPPPMQTNSALSTFKAYDAMALGVAFAIPAKSYAVKAGLVGIGWALGNAAETVSNFHQKISDRHRSY